MNKYNPLYYLLIVLLIMGGFASMAQNDYGIKLLGAVALAFTLLFGLQLFSVLRKSDGGDLNQKQELIALVVLTTIMALRVYYIRFPFIEIVFGGAGLLLAGVYTLKLIKSYRENQSNQWVAVQVLVYYASVVLYILSMISVAFLPSLSEPLGGAAFVLVLVFVTMGILKKEIIKDGQKISSLQILSSFKDRSVVLLTLFLLFTAYMGLTKINLLPKLYSDEYPQIYFEMVNNAEMGKEEPVNGKYNHELFKEEYDRFMQKHASRE